MEIIVRDIRKKDQYKIDDEYLNGYAKLCGVFATAVYNSLSRHADFHTQECFPSIHKIADQHDLSENTVIKALSVLENANIIKKIKTKDPKTKRQLPNVYILLDKSEWKNKEDIEPVKNKRGVNNKRATDGQFESRPHNTEAEKPTSRYGESRPHNTVCKDTHIKDTQLGIGKTKVLQGKEWNELIDAFKPVNPMFEGFYKNKTERAALEMIVSKIGYQKTMGVITSLPEVTRIKYAPKITSPTELKRDLGKLITFYKQQSTNTKGKAIIGL